MGDKTHWQVNKPVSSRLSRNKEHVIEFQGANMRAQAFFPFQQKKSSKIEIMRALLTLLLLFSLEFNGITAIPAGQGSLCFNVPPKKKVRASFMNMDIRGKDRFTAGSTHEFKIRLTPPPDQPNLM